MIDLFVKYAQTLFKEFDDVVDFWLPFNEINVAIWSKEVGSEVFELKFKNKQEKIKQISRITS